MTIVQENGIKESQVVFISNMTRNCEKHMKVQISLTLVALFSIMLFAGNFDYADALKAQGTGLSPKSFGKATSDVVCGDKLCSETT